MLGELKAATGCSEAIVAGLVHGFIGYANTSWEYRAQNYEGASQFPGQG